MFKSFFNSVMKNWAHRSRDVIEKYGNGGRSIDGVAHLHDLVVAQQAQIEALKRFALAVNLFFDENSVVGINNEFWGNKLNDALRIEPPEFGYSKEDPKVTPESKQKQEFVMVHKDSLDHMIARLPPDWAPRVRDAVAGLVQPMPYTVAEFKANCEAEGYVTVKKSRVLDLLSKAVEYMASDANDLHKEFNKMIIDVKG